MKVSVIITTRNEQEHIEDCLKSIKTQNFQQEEIETIVVDNSSTDRTKEVAYRYTDKVYDFGPERSAQRNFGISKVAGKYILYLDADMILSEDVIKECWDKCGRDDFVALYIPEKIVGDGFWIRVRDFERSFYNATVIDCVRFVRRDKCLEIGGFDENLTGPEDWDLDRQIREVGKVGIITAPIYHNEGQFKFKEYLQKKSYYSKTLSDYIKKWGRNDQTLKKQLGFFYRYLGVFTEQGKWKKMLKYPILTFGMYSLRFMVGIIFLLRRVSSHK